MNNEDIELITLYNTLKEEFLYDRENSSFSFNITCCLSRPFKRFIKNSLKCSRTNKKLFAKNFNFVREQFGDCLRTLKCFDAITTKYTLKPTGKGKYHRSSTMSKAEVILTMILFHTSGYRCFIETMNDKLKNIAQVEHSRHRCFDNFIVNLFGAIAAYCLFPKKPCINVQRTH